MKKNLLATLMFGLAASWSIGSAVAAQPDPSGVYVGVQGGSTFITQKNSNENAATYGIYTGYNFRDLFAVELGADAGKKDGVNLKNLDLSVIPRIPVGNTGVGVLVKAGARYSNASMAGASVHGFSPVVGAGIDYRFTKNVSARVLYDYSTKAYGVSGANAGTVTAGLGYKF